jgi:hypothetical protein
MVVSERLWRAAAVAGVAALCAVAFQISGGVIVWADLRDDLGLLALGPRGWRSTVGSLAVGLQGSTGLLLVFAALAFSAGVWDRAPQAERVVGVVAALFGAYVTVVQVGLSIAQVTEPDNELSRGLWGFLLAGPVSSAVLSASAVWLFVDALRRRPALVDAGPTPDDSEPTPVMLTLDI